MVKADKDIGSVTLLIAEIWEKKYGIRQKKKKSHPYKKVLWSH